MKSKHIHNLILQGEHQQLDFKFEISDARKIARTFAAFANTDGGTLLIGVKDNGNIAGVRSEEEKYMADSATTMYCKPEVQFSTKEWNINGKIVLEIIIPRGEEIPYFSKTDEDKWMVYVRIKDQNILANKILVNALLRKKNGEGTYIQYTDKDKLLLEYLENNESVGFSKFRKLAKISPYRAENILTNFLALDIIEIDISEKKVLYKLSESFKAE